MEKAVSPIIGVTIMVAITVFLAGTIAIFVFGMAGAIPHDFERVIQENKD